MDLAGTGRGWLSGDRSAIAFSASGSPDRPVDNPGSRHPDGNGVGRFGDAPLHRRSRRLHAVKAAGGICLWPLYPPVFCGSRYSARPRLLGGPPLGAPALSGRNSGDAGSAPVAALSPRPSRPKRAPTLCLTGLAVVESADCGGLPGGAGRLDDPTGRSCPGGGKLAVGVAAASSSHGTEKIEMTLSSLRRSLGAEEDVQKEQPHSP